MGAPVGAATKHGAGFGRGKRKRTVLLRLKLREAGGPTSPPATVSPELLDRPPRRTFTWVVATPCCNTRASAALIDHARENRFHFAEIQFMRAQLISSIINIESPANSRRTCIFRGRGEDRTGAGQSRPRCKRAPPPELGSCHHLNDGGSPLKYSMPAMRRSVWMHRHHCHAACWAKCLAAPPPSKSLTS
jgi:hypothetical protein